MKVNFTTKEHDALKEIYDIVSDLRTKPERGRSGRLPAVKMLETLLAKMQKAYEQAVAPKVKTTVTVKELLDMARLILGPRLKEQLKPSPVWYRQMQSRIDSRNINKAMAEVAIKAARDTWRGSVWIDTLVNSLDKLAVMNDEADKRSKQGWAVELDSREVARPGGAYLGDSNLRKPDEDSIKGGAWDMVKRSVAMADKKRQDMEYDDDL
jgi:hypothetical protein